MYDILYGAEGEAVSRLMLSGHLMNFHRSIPRPAKSTKTEALTGMVVDVLTLLTLIITGSAVLLAQGRRDA